jgi:LysR family hca operon transcriptional activator
MPREASVVSRPLKGEAPTIELALAFSKSNASPILKLLISKLGDLKAHSPPTV